MLDERYRWFRQADFRVRPDGLRCWFADKWGRTNVIDCLPPSVIVSRFVID